MCNIIYQPQKVNINKAYFHNSLDWNPHGRGLAYPGGSDGVTVLRGMDLKVDTMLALHGSLRRTRPVVSHFRFATRGDRVTDNCHPFPILTRKEDGFALVAFHNGTIRQIESKEGPSDTNLFVNNYIKPILKQDRTILYKKEFQNLLSQILGYNNKMLFLDEIGNIIIINRSQGTELSSPGLPNAWASTGKYLEVKPAHTDRSGNPTSEPWANNNSNVRHYDSANHRWVYGQSPVDDKRIHKTSDNDNRSLLPGARSRTVATPGVQPNVNRTWNSELGIWERALAKVPWRRARSQSKNNSIKNRRQHDNFNQLFHTVSE